MRAKFILLVGIFAFASCIKDEPAPEEVVDIRIELEGAYNITCVRSYADSNSQPVFTINYTDELVVRRVEGSDAEIKVGNTVLSTSSTSQSDNEEYFSFTDDEPSPEGNITELRFFPPDSVSFTDSGSGQGDMITWVCSGTRK